MNSYWICRVAGLCYAVPHLSHYSGNFRLKLRKSGEAIVIMLINGASGGVINLITQF